MFYIFSFFEMPSVDFIHDDTALSKHFMQYPSQSQWMTLRSSSETLNFCLLNLYSVSCCKAFDWFELCLVWMDIRFKNASERKSTSQASCPVRRQVLFQYDICIDTKWSIFDISSDIFSNIILNIIRWFSSDNNNLAMTCDSFSIGYLTTFRAKLQDWTPSTSDFIVINR